MSRVGKSPVMLPEKVEVTIGVDQISVKGPLGTLSQAITPNVKSRESPRDR
jgi:large subunit ribosomal protein L6